MNPPIEPSLFITRWQGMTRGNGLFRMTDAAARTPAGFPAIAASRPYETVFPHGIERATSRTFFENAGHSGRSIGSRDRSFVFPSRNFFIIRPQRTRSGCEETVHFLPSYDALLPKLTPTMVMLPALRRANKVTSTSGWRTVRRWTGLSGLFLQIIKQEGKASHRAYGKVLFISPYARTRLRRGRREKPRRIP